MNRSVKERAELSRRTPAPAAMCTIINITNKMEPSDAVFTNCS